MSTKLIDYVITLGLGSQFIATINSDPQNIFDREYDAELLLRLPSKDEDKQFPSNLNLFAFPNRLKLVNERKESFFHAFVMTEQSGRKFYGFCFTKWTRISKRKMYFIKKRLARDGFVGLITSLYAPICMCIVSQFPLHQSFKKFFTAMIQTLKPSNKFGMNTVKQVYELLDVPFPPKSGDTVEVQISQTRITFSYEHKYQFPPCDVDFGVILRLLSPSNILITFNYLLTEQQIIFVSKEISNLTNCTEALLALLYPFEWPHVYIPVMHKNLSGFFDAPIPYVIGVHPMVLKQAEIPTQSVIVDLDCDCIYIPKKAPLTILPRKYLLKLEYWLCKCSLIREETCKLEDNWLSKLLTKTHLVLKRREFCGDSKNDALQFSDDSDFEKDETFNGNQNSNDTAKLLRKVFLSFFVSVLKRYPLHLHLLLIEKEKIVDLEKIFDSKGFLASQRCENIPFFTQLFKAQMFSYFLQQKITTKKNDIFDQKVLSWIQRYVAGLSLLSASTKSDYCYKKGHFIKNWKYRYFEIKTDTLRYYTNESKTRMRGSIRIIPGISKITIPEVKSSHPTKYPFRIETRNLILECCALNAKSRNEWYKLLCAKAIDPKKRESLIKTFSQSKPLARNSKLISREEPYLAFIKLTKRFIPQQPRVRFSSFESPQLPVEQSSTDVSSEESDEEVSVTQALPTDIHPLKD